VVLSEPEKRNAIHGFLRWRPLQVLHKTRIRVRMGTRLFPIEGYPFCLDVEVDYALGEEGPTVATTAANAGDRPFPYSAGQPPYLSPGPGLVDNCTLQLEAASGIVTDEERQLPTGTEVVADTPYDCREARRLGALQLDFAFTNLTREPDGRAWARLGGPNGHTAELWVDESYPIIELYSGDTLDPDRRRRGLGAKPMTCPLNAFQNGDGVIRLEPGQAAITTWRAGLT
jgi:aldose 1-epimerase